MDQRRDIRAKTGNPIQEIKFLVGVNDDSEESQISQGAKRDMGG